MGRAVSTAAEKVYSSDSIMSPGRVSIRSAMSRPDVLPMVIVHFQSW
jgi:hypothetical protein